ADHVGGGGKIVELLEPPEFEERRAERVRGAVKVRDRRVQDSPDPEHVDEWTVAASQGRCESQSPRKRHAEPSTAGDAQKEPVDRQESVVGDEKLVIEETAKIRVDENLLGDQRALSRMHAADREHDPRVG